MSKPEGYGTLDDPYKKQYPSETGDGMLIRCNEQSKHIRVPEVVINVPEQLNAPLNINLTYNIDARTQIVNDKHDQSYTEYNTTLAVGDSIINALGGVLGKLFE